MAKVRFRLKQIYKNGKSPVHLILDLTKEQMNRANCSFSDAFEWRFEFPEVLDTLIPT